MIKFQGKKWELGVTRNMSLFHGSMDILGQAIEMRRFGTTGKDCFYLVRNGNMASVFFNPENVRAYHRSLEKVCANRKKIIQLEYKYFQFAQALLRAAASLEKTASHGNYKKFRQAYVNLAPSLYLTTALGRYYQNLLQQRLTKIFSDYSSTEREKLSNTITYSGHLTPLTQSQLSLLTIGAALQKKKVGVDKLKRFFALTALWRRHYSRYHFIPVNFNEDPWTEKEMLSQLRNIMKKDCAKEKKVINKIHRYNISQAKKTLLRINDYRLNLYANALQTGGYLNEYRKYVFCRASLAGGGHDAQF